MYHNYTEEELRSYCRTCLESLEMWARRLIHEKMVEKHGKSYVDVKDKAGNHIIKTEIRNHIKFMTEKEPERFRREVDTLFFEHIVYFLCNQNWYKSLFKDAMDYMYPEGYTELRTFLMRLIPIRNALSHGNPISVRQAEQAICYSHDFVEGLKKYYKEKGLEQVWNVPRIIRVTDSLGNSFDNPKDGRLGGTYFRIEKSFYCGDSYSVNIEVDSSFEPSDYNIYWNYRGIKKEEFKDSRFFSITFSEENIAETFSIWCKVISKRNWHKYSDGYDCQIALSMTVLPSIE